MILHFLYDPAHNLWWHVNRRTYVAMLHNLSADPKKYEGWRLARCWTPNVMIV